MVLNFLSLFVVTTYEFLRQTQSNPDKDPTLILKQGLKSTVC